MSREIKVVSPGLLTTIQDKGRYGFQASGVQVSGVMDSIAAELANALVGNGPEAAVLECTFLGPELEFQADSLVAVTGGVPELLLDGQVIQPYKAIKVGQGQRLKVGTQKDGMRAYLAVAGGIAVQEAMGSRSTNLKLGIGGVDGRKLAAGDMLPVGEAAEAGLAMLQGSKLLRQMPIRQQSAGVKKIRAVLGPQDDYFSQEAINAFQEEVYTISNESDRMGYRLEGKAVEKVRNQDLITDGIVFGSVQIPPNGQPIIMLADHQTTGGYPKLATVATVDLPILAQSRPGDQLQFQLVSVQEAQQLLRQQHQELQSAIAAMDKAPHKLTARAKQYKLKINGASFDVTIDEIK